MAKVGTVVIGRYFVVDVKLVESVVHGFMVCWLMMGGLEGLWMSGNRGGRELCQRAPVCTCCWCIAHSIAKPLQAISACLLRKETQTHTPKGIVVECCVAPSCGKLCTTLLFAMTIFWSSSSFGRREIADTSWDVRHFVQFPAYRMSTDSRWWNSKRNGTRHKTGHYGTQS